MVLLAWLFAVASGVANACLLEAGETHSQVVIALSFGPAHAQTVAGDGDDSHNLKAPCLKVCDDGTRSFPKQDPTVAQTDPGPAPIVLVLWGAVAPIIPTLRQMDVVQPARPELPIRFRFSRLTI